MALFPQFQPLSFEQANPLLTGLKGGQEAYSNLIASKFQPQLIQSEIMNKQLSPLATIASNPLLWSIMTPQQQQNIANVISGILPNTSSSKNQDTQLFGGMNQNNILPQQEDKTNNYGGNLPPTSFNRNAKDFNLPGTTGATNPLGISRAQQAGLETSATQEAQAQQQQFKQMYDQAAQVGQNAQYNNSLVDKFSESYDRLQPNEKGSVFGRLPALSSAAQDADMSSSAIADAVARAQQEGHITQADRLTYQSMKPGRFSNEDNKKHAVEFLKGMNLRSQERLPFIRQAQSLGLNPQEIETVWQYYISQRPFYDTKSKKMSNNIDTWEDYLTPQKVKEAFSPKARKKIASSEGLPGSDKVAQILGKPTDDDISYTAKKYGMDEKQVRNYLGIR